MTTRIANANADRQETPMDEQWQNGKRPEPELVAVIAPGLIDGRWHYAGACTDVAGPMRFMVPEVHKYQLRPPATFNPRIVTCERYIYGTGSEGRIIVMWVGWDEPSRTVVWFDERR